MTKTRLPLPSEGNIGASENLKYGYRWIITLTQLNGEGMGDTIQPSKRAVDCELPSEPYRAPQRVVFSQLPWDPEDISRLRNLEIEG